MGWLRHRAAVGGLVAILAVGGAAHFAVSALRVSSQLPASADTVATTTTVLASIDLTDDDNGRAMFPSTLLLPATPVSRCIQIRYSGTRPAHGPGVRIAARNLAGSLVPQLGVAVELGTGGGFAGCAGFHGHRVFTGRLAGLGSSTGISTGWMPSPGETRTYRITVTLDRQTPPGRAAAHFEWSITSTDTADPPSPTPSPTTTPAPVVTHPANHSVSPRPGPSSPAEPAGAKPSNPALCVAPPDPDWADRMGDGFTQILRAVVTVTVLGVRDGTYLIVLLLLLLLFLLLHRLVDRRDPKLALAPLANNRYAYMPDDGEIRYLPIRATGTLRLAIPAAGAGIDDENNGGADGHA